MVSTDSFAGWAGNGSLLPYASQLPNADDFYDGLVQAFTQDGKFFCAPKDFSTLALVINTDNVENVRGVSAGESLARLLDEVGRGDRRSRDPGLLRPR